MRRVRGVLRDRRGHATIMFAGALTMLCGVGAIAVDAGTLMFEKRRLQGIADAAALSAAADPLHATAAAEASLALTPTGSPRLVAITAGSYSADPAVSPTDRFRAGTAGNAVSLEVGLEASTYFARVFGLREGVPITARATAARMDHAAFSIGSRLAGVDRGLANAVLSAVAGTDLKLTVLDYRALAAAQVDLLGFVTGLRAELRLDGATLGDVLRATPTLRQALRAAAGATSDPAASAVLMALSGRVADTRLALEKIIDLGPIGTGTAGDSSAPIKVDALSILRAFLSLGGDHDITSDVGLTIPGLTSARLRLAVGEPAASSPWIAVDAARTVTVRTAQARAAMDVTLSSGLLGLGAVHVPLYLDLAPAEASLGDITCSGGRAATAVTLNVTPSVGTVALADYDATSFGNFGRTVSLRPATLVRAPLVAVTGYADTLLGRRTRPTAFDATEIANTTPHTVTTDDVLQSTVGSLLSRATIKVDVLGLGVDTRAITTALGPILTAAAGPLDQLTNQVLALLGVGIGQADVWVNGVRCGRPTLVG